MGMPFGFVVEFWGVFGSLAFSKAWRYAFFKFLDASSINSLMVFESVQKKARP